jgi:hypothetical protein
VGNARKSDFLTASYHVGRWRSRLAGGEAAELLQLAQLEGWEAGAERRLAVARGNLFPAAGGHAAVAAGAGACRGRRRAGPGGAGVGATSVAPSSP